MENVSISPTFYYTMTSDTEDTEEINPIIYHMVQTFMIMSYSITFILGTTGNGLVIWIAGFKMKKTVNTLWFLNLAIADFAFDILFPLQITEWILDGHWPFGQTMCKVIYTILFLNMSVSISFLMIISIDRCLLIMCPVWSKNHRSPRSALTISVMIWSTCFMLSSPYLSFLDIIHDSENSISYCTSVYADDYDADTKMDQTLTVFRFVTMFLIPFSIIAICYSLVIFQIRRSRSLARSNRPLKVIIAIVLSFFCFWFPFYMWPFLEVLNVEFSITVDFIMSNLVCCIGFFNSCINPMVYVFVGRDFKETLSKSISFLLENTFKEKDISNTEPQYEQTMMETEMEDYTV